MEPQEFNFCKEHETWLDEYVEKLVLEGLTEEELENEYQNLKTTYGSNLANKFETLKSKLLLKKATSYEYQKYCKRYKKRKHLEKLLQEIPEGIKIKIDKDFLEELLFEKVIITYQEDSDKTEYTAKYPIWTGPFLRKIDLSEVDFSYVDWSCGYGLTFPVKEKRIYDYDYKNKKCKKNDYLIDLSYTNANIDFERAFQTKITPTYKKTNIYKCNFSHIDLSNSNFKHIHSIEASDLSYTNIKIQNECYEVRNTSYKEEEILGSLERFIEDSSFEGNNMEDITIEAEDMCTNIKNSNFKDTKIKIIDKDSEAVYLDMIYEEFIAPGYLENCYINEELIINKSKQRQR